MRLVILGTGTAVGKTFVAAHLARALTTRAPGRPLLALKPVETGFQAAATSDAALLETTARLLPPPSPHPLFAFRRGVSPHLAARHALTEISLPAIVSWLHAATLHYTTLSPMLLVETAGGVFSPLAPATTNFDLAVALDPAIWLLVAPDALGVLHDLTATLVAMRSRHRVPDLVVLTASRPPDESTTTNADELASLGICTVDASLQSGDPRPLDALAERLLSRCP
jgi:dethiobiotin synthetase